MNVKVIWPDGSTEVRDHTLLKGLQKKRDNGDIIRPLAMILQADGSVYNMTDHELGSFLQQLSSVNVSVPPIMGFFDKEKAPTLDTKELKGSLQGVRNHLKSIHDLITEYEEQVNR